MLAHGPEAQAEGGLEEDPPGQGDQEEGQVDQGGKGKTLGAPKGQAVYHLLGVGGVAVEVGEHQAGGSQGQEVDGGGADDLVGPVFDGDHRMHQGHQPSHQHGA